MKLLKPATTKKVETKIKEETKIKAEIKKEKNIVKKAPKNNKIEEKKKINLLHELESQIGGEELSEEDMVAMQRLLDKARGIATPKASTPTRKRSGEY